MYTWELKAQLIIKKTERCIVGTWFILMQRIIKFMFVFFFVTAFIFGKNTFIYYINAL